MGGRKARDVELEHSQHYCIMPLCMHCMEEAEAHPPYEEREYKAIQATCSRCGATPAHAPVDPSWKFDVRESWSSRLRAVMERLL